MTQEDKELLLKDLSTRLPYGVICQVTFEDSEGWKTEDMILKGIINKEGYFVTAGGSTYSTEFKPYLRSMSSMTEKELYEVQEILGEGMEIRNSFISIIDSSINSFTYLELQAVFKWFNTHHFDYCGLIPMGLAIDCTNLNIY